MLGFFSSGGKVDICQGVEFIHDYVYVITADSGAKSSYTFAFIFAGYGVELTVAYLAFL